MITITIEITRTTVVVLLISGQVERVAVVMVAIMQVLCLGIEVRVSRRGKKTKKLEIINIKRGIVVVAMVLISLFLLLMMVMSSS